MVDRSKPLPTSLQNEFIPKEVLLSLSYAVSAGPCPENLLPPKKIKTPKGTLPRLVDHVWHPVRRSKFKYLIDHPVSLTGAGRIVEEYHDLYTFQRGRMENDIKHLMAERDIWSSATYELALKVPSVLSLKVIERNRIILAKRLYLSEKGWNKYAKHFIILLSTKDTADLVQLQKLTQKWRTLMNKFEQEVEQSEESTREKLQIVKDGLIKWQPFFRNNNEKDILPSNKGNRLESILLDLKQWQKLLNDEKEKFTGDRLVSKYDSLKIIKHLQESWTDTGLGIFDCHKSIEGEIPPEQQHMEETVKSIERLQRI